MTIGKLRRLGSRLLLLPVSLTLAACSADTDLQAPAGDTAAVGGPSSSTHAPRADRDGPAEAPGTYSASVRPIDAELRERMRFSHRPGCPVQWRQLRYLRMTYVDFDGDTRTGEMVVNKAFAPQVTKVFKRLYEARWPIARMRLVDRYRGNDNRSMAANNTSGYNCRHVAGTDEWSAHAYGAAIDINPVQNPYLGRSRVAPPSGQRFADIDRSAGVRVPAGAIRDGDIVVRAFARIGWHWGGDWATASDFQHFFASEDSSP